jgi:hypothetical protein
MTLSLVRINQRLTGGGGALAVAIKPPAADRSTMIPLTEFESGATPVHVAIAEVTASKSCCSFMAYSSLRIVLVAIGDTHWNASQCKLRS